MSSYQRYLRERKETHLDELELDEARAMDRRKSSLSPETNATIGKYKGAGVFDAVPNEPPKDTAARQADLAKRASSYSTSSPEEKEKQRQLAAADAQKARREKPGFSTKADPEKMGNVQFPDKPQDKQQNKPQDKPQDTYSDQPSATNISGNTLVTILRSAGIKGPTAEDIVKRALEAVLRENNLEIDSSFFN